MIDTLGTLIVLYTNGILMTQGMAGALYFWGVRAVNIGLHIESTFATLIDRVSSAWPYSGLRFHAEDRHKHWQHLYPDVAFRFWKMDDCERENERRVVLVNEEKA